MLIAYLVFELSWFVMTYLWMMLYYDCELIAYPCLSNLGYISSWCYNFIWYAHYEMEFMNILWIHGFRGSSSHIYFLKLY
jgi:hypothetical protein